jgi:catechol 2,3-dioxygenase-like lactoylglutathione lyase family enzyme
MPVRFITATPVLVVRRVEPTRSFFCDRLGFAATTEEVRDGELAFVRLERDGATVIVESDAHGRERFSSGRDDAAVVAQIVIEVDDVMPLVAEIADADIVFPLRRTADGRHEIGVREPGGNLIVFASLGGA